MCSFRDGRWFEPGTESAARRFARDGKAGNDGGAYHFESGELKGGAALVLEAAGPEAAPVSVLSVALFVGGGLVLLVVLVWLGIALFGPQRWRERVSGERPILGLGLAFPVVVLTGLLVIGLAMTASLSSSEAKPGALPIRVEGEQWWWRVSYPGFETANEIVIPTGRPVQLQLVSDNVIHSFWVPQLSGKRDMIPGHDNRLNIQADRPGTYFGICAEYCGGPHALMQMRVHALAPADYARWEAGQRRRAAVPGGPEAREGAELFLTIGCGKCHTVRGTPANGHEGPDLTHIASRSTLASGIMPMGRDELTRWTRHAQDIKPNNLMPEYPYAPVREIDAISAYLMELE